MTNGRSPVGLVLGSALPPASITQVARKGEELGFGELWLAEDYFFTGGISGATAVLAATSEIPVGLGVVSAMVRHPAVLAMEISTLAHMFPGRVRPGIGLGLPAWIGQMGLTPPSQLTALRECMGSLRRLLRGDEVTEAGRSFAFEQVRLTYPVAEDIPLSMGVIGPKMLQLAGEIADGTVLSILAGTDYVKWARDHIATGAATAGRNGNGHRIATFAVFSVDTDGQEARNALRPLLGFYLTALARSSLTEVYGIADELAEMTEGGPERVAAEMPDEWIADLNVAGDPEECAAQIRALLDSGSDSVVLFPAPAERAAELIELAAKEVLPRVG
jgi:alkanesulfonate monooxygenase SsuD/methylene tetrahydromethanopterin reductase-like flavin-dependent oxidoreductase (luciferase family)